MRQSVLSLLSILHTQSLCGSDILAPFSPLLLFLPDNTENYDPDYDFLHQDLSVGDNLPPIPVGGCLSPLPESLSESSSPVPGQHPSHPRFSAPPQQQGQQHQPEYWTPQPNQTNPLQSLRISAPPALPQKKRRSAQPLPFPDVGSRVLYERYPSQYDNLSEEERHPTPPFPLFTPISPMPQTNGGVFVAQFIAGENADVPASPPPLPEKKSKHSKAGKDKGLSNECKRGGGLSVWEQHVHFILILILHRQKDYLIYTFFRLSKQMAKDQP